MKVVSINDIADALDALQKEEHDGRGVQCVKVIVSYLRRGDWDSAIAVRKIDGDKIRQYPKIETAMNEFFGCRAHGVVNCKSDWCI